MKKLFTINTINNFMELIYDPFVKPFAEDNKDIEVVNIMDDSLLSDTRKHDGITPEITSRMLFYAKAAEESGADGIIVTCTSVNQATKSIRPLLRIPIINIEEPVAEQAVQAGTRIGILATLPTSPVAIARTIREKAEAANKPIELLPEVAEGAFEVLCAGDRERHDAMVNRALAELAQKVDCIVFAQISMSLLEHDPLPVPVFKIGRSGLERIKEYMA